MNSTDQIIYGPYGWIIGPADALSAHIANCKCGALQTSANEDETKHTITLLFKREALLYDISNAAYVEGKMQAEGGEEARRKTLDITEEGNADHITRILDLVHALCNEALYPYTQHTISEDLTISDDFAETKVYVITLSVGEKFSETTALLLERLIHQYLVWMALADWLAITNPQASVKWQAKAEGVLDEVKSIAKRTSGIVLRPLRPW